MMAEAIDRSKPEKVSKETDDYRLGMVRRWEKETGQRASTRFRTRPNGAERLRIAADKKVGRNSNARFERDFVALANF